MPFKTELVSDQNGRRIETEFSGAVTDKEVLQSLKLAMALLDQEESPLPVVAILENGSTLREALPVALEVGEISKFSNHRNLKGLGAWDKRAREDSFWRIMQRLVVRMAQIENLRSEDAYLRFLAKWNVVQALADQEPDGSEAK